jgi:hypothetical protein
MDDAVNEPGFMSTAKYTLISGVLDIPLELLSGYTEYIIDDGPLLKLNKDTGEIAPESNFAPQLRMKARDKTTITGNIFFSIFKPFLN